MNFSNLYKDIKRNIKPFVLPVIDYLKLAYFQAQWRNRNLHNDTTAENIFPYNKVSIGKGTYGGIFAYTFGNPNEYLSIGNYCSIANDVVFLLGGNHDYKTLSTFPFGYKIYGAGLGNGAGTKGPIIVEDDVWIGYRSLILSGVTLGKGCIIAAGSIVTHDVPPYAIYASNHIIKYRFSQNIISKLQKHALDMNDIQLNILKDYYQLRITDVNIDQILNALNTNVSSS